MRYRGLTEEVRALSHSMGLREGTEKYNAGWGEGEIKVVNVQRE